MNLFPSEGRKVRLDFFGKHPRDSHELSLSTLRYVNLCSEELLSLHKEITFQRRVEDMGSRAKANTRQYSRARMAETSRGVPILSRVPDERSQFNLKASAT